MPATPQQPVFDMHHFDYQLPAAQIAQQPLPERSASRLLVRSDECCEESSMRHFARYLRAGDVLVMNDSRVVRARFLGRKQSGGKIEVLIERVLNEHQALAQIRASKSPPAGSLLHLEEAFDVEVLAREGVFFRLAFPTSAPIERWLSRYGRLPLPPYISRPANANDDERYQTIFARSAGSVAAPTAGLHFDQNLLDAIAKRGATLAWVTLHVGAGTFQPVRSEDLTQHKMHTEHYHIPPATIAAIEKARHTAGRVIAVGTTSLRALEAAAADGTLRAGDGETDLFILPGYRFQVVDALLTNFHLPRSTLLMLVCAFAGSETISAAYTWAIAAGFRFFSYGDAMFITRKNEPHHHAL